MKIIYISNELHSALKIKAIHHGKTLQAVTDEILSNNLQIKEGK